MPFGDSIQTIGPDAAFNYVTLLYVGVKDGVWNVSRWFSCIDKLGLKQTEEALFKLAQSDNPEQFPEFQGFGFEGITFAKYKSYFTVVLDSPGYSFHDGAETDPIWFLEKKDNSSLPPPPAPVVPNKSFYGLEKVVVCDLPALRCRNYLRNGITGAPLKEGETQGFIFNIYISAAYAHGGGGNVVLAIDPDGTNSGPDG
jgi:hypothetical protein